MSMCLVSHLVVEVPEGNWFSQEGKTIRTELLCKKTFPLDGQTSTAKFLKAGNLP